MARIIVAAASESSRAQMAGLLTSAGFHVFRVCDSGSAVRRAVTDGGDGVVVIMRGLKDSTADDLAWDLLDRVRILYLAPHKDLERCACQDLFRLALPCQRSEIIGAVEILTQLHQMALPKRSRADRELVLRAKRLLMAQEHLTEAEAHRAMQRYAMDHCIKMTDYAAQLVQALDKTEE